MNTKQWVVGTVAGAVVVYVVGYILFEFLLGDFYAANSGSATRVSRDPQIQWAVGATFGLLIWAIADFTLYGITNKPKLA